MTELPPPARPVAGLSHVSKTFGGVKALIDITLGVAPGEIVAIVGDNGAGKSTLMKILAGVHEPTTGSVLLDGEPASFAGPAAAKEAGVEVVYQDLALAENQSVFMNMFLGRELTRRPIALLDKKRMRRATADILNHLDVHIPSTNAPVRNLSGGQRQGIAIGRAVHWATRLVLMDEPTAALGVQETAKVEQTIKRLRQRGLAVLLVSHNMDQVFRLAQRVCVLRRGSLVAQRRVCDTDTDDIVGLITGARPAEH